jgi:hypothetical protein
MADRRTGPKRANASIKITVVDSTSNRTLVSQARMRNLGRSGFAFVAEEKLARGTMFKYRVNTGFSEIHLTGRVVHMRTEASYFVYGVKIEGLSFGEKGQFNRFLLTKFSDLQKTFLVYSLGVGIAVALGCKFVLGASFALSLVVFFAVTILCFVLLPF